MLGLDDLRECGPIMRDACFALTEQASEDARPAHVVLVHSERVARGSRHARSSREAGVHDAGRRLLDALEGSPDPPAPAATYQAPVT